MKRPQRGTRKGVLGCGLGLFGDIYKVEREVVIAAIDIPEDWFESYGESPQKKKSAAMQRTF